MNLEALGIARDCASMTRDDLREALKTASAIEALLLLPLIVQITEVRNQIHNIITAANAKE